MKPQEFAYVLAAVLFRTAAVATALFGLFMILSPILMMGAGGMSLMFLRIIIVYFGAAVALWFISKPAGALIARGLSGGPDSASKE